MRVEEPASPLISALHFVGWLLLGATWVAILFKVVGEGFISVLKRRQWSRSSVRGFEVQQTTGAMPVLKEKENDHG